jgi:arylsulfatase A-like enzyme
MNQIVTSMFGRIALAYALLVTGLCAAPSRLPNLVFILADDLGYGDLGCYGQQKIKTPNLDRLAREGMKLLSHYSGHNVCAPSRCVLMSGKHPGHGYIRENRGGVGERGEGQEPVPAGELSLPLTLRRLGYTLGAFGKWGLGPVGSTGDPQQQGFQRFYGYNCQAVAHNYYPTHLWSNETRIALNNPKFAAHQSLGAGVDPSYPSNYARFRGTEYAPDLIASQALEFVRENRDRPFFLYYPTTIPHLALQVPDDSLAEYAGRFPEEPYVGGRSYLPHPTPRAAYAAMVSRLDREVGRILDLLRELGLEQNTLVVFTSDNGPLYDRLGGTDTEFFNSAGGLRGRKGSYYEGGFRVPCLVRWTGRIPPGSVSTRVTGFEDWLPTLLELMGRGAEVPKGIDGFSFARTLLGKNQTARSFLYRESPGYGGQQCVRDGKWKLVRRHLNPNPNSPNTPAPTTELYNLAVDPAESTDVATEHPRVVARLAAIARQQHRPSKLWPMSVLERESGK